MTDTLALLKEALADRYTIERELGAGGMATVYLAEDLKHHRKVAVKVLRPELAATLGAERFLREIEIAAGLTHPHILPVHDSGEADGFLYYVMPFVKGESLRDRIGREGKLPIGDTIRLLRDVADGLAEAHRQGLAHRDVKPDNVMISGKHAVVTDFGVAKAVTSATGAQALTTAGVSLGTPSYMSPEQAAAEPVDHRTDIYALGVMGYELLAGRPPFVGPSTQAVLMAQMTADPEPFTDRRPDTPPALEQLIMKCLAKKPEHRWQTTDEVLQQLEAMATPSGGVPSLRVAAVDSPATRRTARRWKILGIAAAGLASATVVIFLQQRAAATRALITELQPAVDAGRFDDVYTTLQREGAGLDNGGLEAIAAAVGGMLTLETDPSGASVALTRLPPDLDAAGAAIDFDASPIRSLTVVTGDDVAAVHREGYEPVDFIFHVAVGETLALRRSLVSESWEAEDMVLVEAGSVSGPLASTFTGAEVEAFLIDRYEVSNRIFMEFVADGGYALDDFWPDSLRIDGELRPWSRAVSTFVDRTGLPGPRSWSGGTFPEGRGDHPVASVSWYEARAFARWAGKELPTMAQWWRAALGDRDRPFPWGGDLMTIDDRSNFGMVGSTPVDQHRFGLSPYGCYDMAGNVREWLQEQAADGRFSVLGGSWQDPTYMFSTPNVERFPPWLANEAVGFRLVRPVPER